MTADAVEVRKREFLKNNKHVSDVEHLKEWLSKQQHLPSVSDEQLLTFLNSCNNSLEAAKTCIEAYFTIKSAAPEFFRQRDPLCAEIKHITQVVHITTLTATSPEGYRYIFTRLHNTDPALYQPDSAVKLCYMVMDATLRDNVMAPGIIMISDMRGFLLSHAIKATPSSIKKQIAYLQEAMPVRLKAMHIINATPLVNTIMTIIKPFMNKETLELLHFHVSAKMDDFYKSVPKKLLPKDYGGDDLHTDQLFENTLKELESCREWFKEGEELCQVDESKREIKKNGGLEGLQGSFKKLDID